MLFRVARLYRDSGVLPLVRQPAKWHLVAFLAKVVVASMLVSSSSAQPPITFSIPARYDFPIGALPSEAKQALAAADFNNDTLTDLVANVETNLAVFLNPGTGTLQPPAFYARPAGETKSVTVADFNQDGWIDIALVAGSQLAVYFNRLDGTFSPAVVFAHGFPFSRGGYLCAADFNRDNFPDIVVTYPFNSISALRIFQNLKNGTFSLVRSLSEGNGPVQCADLNGDGAPDFVTHPDATTFMNQSGMTFTSRYYQAPSPGAFLVRDLTGDGFPDYLGQNVDTSLGPLIYLPNNRDGTLASRQDAKVPGWSPPNDITAGDLDLDGDLDIVAVSRRESFLVGTNLGGGVFSPPVPVFFSNTQDYQGKCITLMDLNNDGQLDLLGLATDPNAPDKDYLFVALNQTHPTVPKGPSAVLPNKGGNAGMVTVSISIPGLPDGATLVLVAPGKPDIVGLNPRIKDYIGTRVLTVSFDLRGAAPGKYDVIVKAGNTILLTMRDGFTVESGGEPDIWMDVVGRSRIRGGRGQDYFILYGNRGTVDSGSFRIWLSFPTFLSWQTAPEFPWGSAGQLGEKAFVAFDIPAVAAGANGSVSIRIQAPDTPDFAHRFFEVQVWEEGQ